jgi:hypothetical protein
MVLVGLLADVEEEGRSVNGHRYPDAPRLYHFLHHVTMHHVTSHPVLYLPSPPHPKPSERIECAWLYMT